MLDTLFSPQSVAVIGATDSQGKLGYAILQNIIKSGFKGRIYPVNPGKEKILGLICYKNLNAVKEKIELAVIVIPGKSVLNLLESCGKQGVGSAIVISAGFRETGHDGLMAERKITDIAQKCRMRILGPNCLGVIDALTPMNATFAAGMPRRGKIAFMSQSGALCASIVDIALAEGVGFSHFVSLGNKADLDEIDFLEAWTDDPEAKVVMAYLEGITHGTRFIEIAQRFTKSKPIVIVKSGVTNGGSRAVSSHTGTLAGSEQAYEAAFKQAGVLRAGSVSELFDLSIALARQPLPPNENVAVMTNAGGPGIMATDALERIGLTLAPLTKETMGRLREVLPAAASVLNPVDVLGDATTERFRSALQLVSADPNVGALIVILAPTFTTNMDELAQVVADAASHINIPLLACFMGEATIQGAVKILINNHVPNYLIPERAVKALKAMVDYRRWQERPLPEFKTFDADRQRVAKIFQQVRTEGRLKIGDADARSVMEAYSIPVPASKLCKTAEEAAAFAEEIGYPVVMKIASPDILHKTDIGGVRLNIQSGGDVRDSFDLLTFRARRYMPDAEIWGCQVQQQVRGGVEVIIGMNRDPQFGPLVMFGLGGVYVETLHDVAFRIPPFSLEEAKKMMQETRSFNLLRGVRGQAQSDIEALADTLLRVSQLVTQFQEIVEMDINPLIVFEKGKGVMSVDARLVLASQSQNG
jgi:acetyltransferase